MLVLNVPEESQGVAHINIIQTRLYVLRRLQLERWIRIPYGTGPGRGLPRLMRSKLQKLRAHLVKLEDMKTHLLNIIKSMEHLQELRYARLIPYLSTPLKMLQTFRCEISEFSCPSGYTDVPLNALLPKTSKLYTSKDLTIEDNTTTIIPPSSN